MARFVKAEKMTATAGGESVRHVARHNRAASTLLMNPHKHFAPFQYA
jgi:hypothetical protein